MSKEAIICNTPMEALSLDLSRVVACEVFNDRLILSHDNSETILVSRNCAEIVIKGLMDLGWDIR